MQDPKRMCEKVVDACLPALRFVLDWFTTDKVLKNDYIVFSNDDLVFINADSDSINFLMTICVLLI